MNSSLYGSLGIIFYGPQREFKLTTIIQAIEVLLYLFQHLRLRRQNSYWKQQSRIWNQPSKITEFTLNIQHLIRG